MLLADELTKTDFIPAFKKWDFMRDFL